MDERAASLTSPPSHQDFGWALGTLLRAYLKQVQAVVAELPGGPRAYQVMSFVAAETCRSQVAIAERLGLDRTAITYLLDGLEAQKLVKRTPDPVDRRVRHVNLTPEGTATLARLAARVSHIERHLLSGLAEADAEQLRTTLGQAARQVEGAGDIKDTCQLAESIEAGV